MSQTFLAETFSRHFVDKLINESVFSNRDAMYRARILVYIALVAIAALATVSGFLIWLASTDFSALLLPLTIFCLGTMFVLLYILKRFDAVDLCCALAVILALAAIIFVIAITGGPYFSPTCQLLFLPCLMSFLFGGTRLGVTTLVICLVMLVGMLTAQLAGHEFPQILNAEFRVSGNMTVLTINFIFASILAFSYENTSVALKRERDQEHLKFIELARIDPLTGLANRRIFDEVLQSRITLYERMSSKPGFVLCYLDLDKFKPINDNYGHDVGDEVLRITSNRLLSALRGADFLGRQGGDEFMMLFDGVQSAEAIGALGIRLLHLIREPIRTQAGILEVDASIGFAAYPQHGRDAISLRTATDAAMYEAKRNRCGFHIC